MSRKNTKKIDAIIIAVLVLICVAIGIKLTKNNKENTAAQTAQDTQSAQTKSAAEVTYKDYAGKRIGVCTGMIFDVMVQDNIPDAEVSYFNGYPDIVTALMGNAIDAFAADEPVIRYMEIENPELAHIKEYMDEYSYGYCFAKTPEGKELCDKFSEYIKKLKADGTLAEIDSTWFSNDKDKQILPPLNELSAENGTLKMALQSVNPPFVYMKDGSIVGYDVDIAYRFCKEHGYGLELVDMNFDALINSVQSGTCDFAASCMTITEERSQSVYFSEPNYLGGAVIAVRKADIANTENVTESAAKTVDWRDYNGKKLGIITGTSFEEPTLKNFPNSEFLYYNSYSDINVALEQGLIDGYLGDEPALRAIHTEQPQINFFSEMVNPDDYAFGFQKDTEKSKKLCGEFNEFLEKCKADGTLEELDEIWFGTDESKKVVDFSEIENNPERLKVVTTSTDNPFSYIKDGKYVGSAIALAVKFCKEYGYSMDIESVDFAARVPGLASGKYDMCVSSLTITPERAESILFSEPFYNGGVVLAVRSEDIADIQQAAVEDVKWQDYNGKKIGIITGTSFEEPTLKNFPDSEFLYYNSYSDINVALDQGLIDGYVGDEPVLRTVHTEQPQIDYIKEMIDPDEYAFAFQKDTEKSKKLCAEFNEFLEKCKADGTLDELDTIWFGTDESKKVVDFSEIENNPEKLKVVTTSTDNPFSYIKDGKNVGYAMALAVKFCKEYGYSIDIEDVDFSARVPGLVSGKYDMCVSSLAITPERAESVLFSEPFYNGGIVLAVRSSDLAASAPPAEQDKEITEKTGFFKKLKNSFEKNFIREDRWKLIAQGILTTIIITVLSTLFGTILAFLICIFRRTGSRLAVLLSKIYVRILQGTPIVVLLMILYYIVFGKTGINAVIVAVIGFSLNLAAYVSEMMRSGIESIDPGQREAALALGFTERQAFYKFIFPQAATRFLPVYKGEIISLLKNTSVVGYIAIQDLTKMSDIIRSRTYEAFFPLIATALIYFALAWLITFILGKVEIGVTPKERKKRAKN